MEKKPSSSLRYSFGKYFPLFTTHNLTFNILHNMIYIYNKLIYGIRDKMIYIFDIYILIIRFI